MPDTSFSVLRRSDVGWLDSLEAFARALSMPQDVRVGITPVQQHSSVDVVLASRNEHPLVQFARENATDIWPRLTLNTSQGIQVAITRDERGDDQVKVAMPDGKHLDATRIAVAARATLGPPARTTSIEMTLGPELAEFYLRREQTLARLEELSRNIIEESDRQRRELQAAVSAESENLRRDAAETETRLKGDYAEKLSALEARAAELDARQREFDDRSARHVRRESVKGLKQIIASREQSFKLTKDTQAKRIPIHAIFCALIVMASIVLLNGLFGEPPSSSEVGAWWLHALRVPGGVLGFTFASIFYIRWNDQWFRQHADEEFRMRQLELDVDRASWVTELALESRDDKGELPTALIDRLSAGLFVPRSTEPVRHPAQDLAATLIGAASHLKVSLPGGIEADLNRSGVKKVRDEIQNG